MNDKQDLLNKISDVMGFSAEERQSYIDEYNLSLNLKLLELSGLSGDELKNISDKSTSPEERYRQILGSVKDKVLFLAKFDTFMNSLHRDMLASIIETANEDQKKQLAEYLIKVEQTPKPPSQV